MEEKRCTRCGQSKPVNEFHFLRKGKPWRASNCLPCEALRLAEYRRNQPSRIKATQARFRERHPLRAKLTDMEKQARYGWKKAGLPVVKFSYEEILDRDGWTCYLCGEDVLECELSFDHVIPKSEAGPHAPDNVKVCHIRCNDSKGGKVAANARWMGRSQATPRGCHRRSCPEHPKPDQKSDSKG